MRPVQDVECAGYINSILSRGLQSPRSKQPAHSGEVFAHKYLTVIEDTEVVTGVTKHPCEQIDRIIKTETG
jgi:hypothetical protein